MNALDSAYLSFPYFHWPTLSAAIRSKRYAHDRPFFALIMSLCADASARIHNGAQIPPTSTLPHRKLYPPSELFYHASLDAMTDSTIFTFDTMRTEAVLALYCVQCHELRGAYRHLHRYLGMSAEIGFHNEARWPMGLDRIEVEERRRLVSHSPGLL